MENRDHFLVILNALSELDYLIEWRIINPISVKRYHFEEVCILSTARRQPKNERSQWLLECYLPY